MTWREIQEALTTLGYYTGLLDGVPGEKTAEAVSRLLSGTVQTAETMWDRHPHFTPEEFVCRCGCGLLNTEEPLLDMAEDVRRVFGGNPLVVTSGTRCQKHNDAQPGSAKNSRHLTGRALDGCIPGVRPQRVVDYVARSGGWGYCIDNDYFHIDLGG